MIVSNEVRALLRLCAIRVENKSLDWSMVARAARAGALETLLAGDVPHSETVGTRTSATPILRYGLAHADAAEERVAAELDAADLAGARLITVLDEDYPANLTDVPDLPPFLFVRGSLAAEDACSAAVVGTRQASAVGLDRAARMSRELVQAGVTVVSGLARGVDTAGHSAALEAGGAPSPSWERGSQSVTRQRTVSLPSGSLRAALLSASSGRLGRLAGTLSRDETASRLESPAVL